jgi:predicted Zn-dependent protease
LLRRAAPKLFAPAARGIEGVRTVGAIAASAWALALVFLVGVPMAAEPIAAAMPPMWRHQIGDIAWSQAESMTQYCDDGDAATRILNDLADRLMAASNVPQRSNVSIVIVNTDMPNAFAMPDDTIVVTNSLIAMAEQPDEIAGVIGHEIGHIELNHVMTGYVRRMGAGVFFDVVFGGGGLGQAIAVGTSASLSGLGYDREAEAAADRRGFEYLERAHIDPGGLGRLFDRFARLQHEHNSGLAALLSNHPASAERAAAARAHARPGSAPSLTPAQWRIVRAACGGSATQRRQPAAPNPQQTPSPQPSPAPPQESASKPH